MYFDVCRDKSSMKRAPNMNRKQLSRCVCLGPNNKQGQFGASPKKCIKFIENYVREQEVAIGIQELFVYETTLLKRTRKSS